MVARIAVIACFVAQIYAADLASDLENIISPRVYAANKSKIKELFRNENDFLDARKNVDYAKVTEVLRQNSLLNLRLNSSADLRLVFQARENLLMLVKIVNSSLERLGYKYFKTASLDNTPEKVAYGVFLDSRSLLNLGSFYKELAARGVYILSVVRDDEFSYTYVLDARKAFIATKLPNVGEFIKSPEPYFYKIAGAKELIIKSEPKDAWYPCVRIYDKNLRLIQESKFDEPKDVLELNLPSDAAYVQISDAFLLDNIKNGLKINIK